MQETRQHILEILHQFGDATVDDITSQLQTRRGAITTVTVRHHLERLQQEDLITEPRVLYRTTPGRPRHIYALTEKAQDFFPSNYQHLATVLLEQLSEQLSPVDTNVIFQGVADRMVQEAHVPEGTLPERLNAVVDYLNQQGYNARWEACSEGYILYTDNCPFHQIAQTTKTLCDMDMRLVASMLGMVPRWRSRISDGAPSCSFLVSETPPDV